MIKVWVAYIIRVTVLLFIPPFAAFTTRFARMNKYRWTDPKTGHRFASGGILFYDSQGVWVVAERDGKNGIIYNDMGGKYTYEDGTIHASIARELREETYGLCELRVGEVRALGDLFTPVYVNGHDGKPAYFSLPIDFARLPADLRRRIVLDPDQYLIERKAVIDSNRDVPVEYYPMFLRKLSMADLKDPRVRLSFRLRKILRISGIVPDMARVPSPEMEGV